MFEEKLRGLHDINLNLLRLRINALGVTLGSIFKNCNYRLKKEKNTCTHGWAALIQCALSR